MTNAITRRLPIVLVATAFAGCAAAAQSGERQNTAVSKQQVLWEKLGDEVREVDKSLDGVMGVAIEDLATGQKYFLHEDEVFPQASSIKIAVLAELYHQNQEATQGTPGKIKLSDAYVVDTKDMVQDSDIMLGLTPGVTRVTNRDLATMMVAVSDNSATNVLIDRLGMQNVNALLGSLGLTRTRLNRKMMDVKAADEGRENVSTPREMMELLELIYRGKVLNREMTDGFFKMLSTHKYSAISRDLPEGLRIADKPGELEGVRTDSGVVFATNRPYVISVMTTYLRNERDGVEAIARISSATYRMFDRLGGASKYSRVVSTSNGSNAH
jgi:beta-lactamase class A